MTDRARFFMPPGELPITEIGPKGFLAGKPWYMFFSQLYSGVVDGNQQPPTAVTVTASPFIFTATIKGQVAINGGTGVSVDLARGIVGYAVPPPPCLIPMSKGDQVRITYATPPTLVFFPM